jgi:hypothetical protein
LVVGVNLVSPLPVAVVLVLPVIQRVAAPPEVKVLLVVLVDLVEVQEMVLVEDLVVPMAAVVAVVAGM